ncbi:MAG: hypothetical protein LUE86_13580 [Clostridiales bacterium]|nr:hypothetical protein [Clostridiales bacterium]
MEKQLDRTGKTQGESLGYSWFRHALQWRTELLVLGLLAAFACFVNRDMKMEGLYMDDLYQWYSFHSVGFLQAIFTFGGTRCRFLYNLAAYLEMAVFGPNVNWYVPFNILLNTLIAYTIYWMSHRFSRSPYMGVGCGLAYLMSRMAYYQIGQALGLMESMALWLAIMILYLLYEYLNDVDGQGEKRFLPALGLYLAVCFVHERYMVLLPLFFVVLLFRRCRDIRLWIASVASFGAVQLIRFLVIGSVSPAGTGGTNVADTVSVSGVIKFVLSQVAYLFGVNAGPEHLNGQNWREAPMWVTILIVFADLMLILFVITFLARQIRVRRNRILHLKTATLFVMFIGACIVCSSVTIRVEMRWIYVSYAAALLFLSWMYGVLTEGTMEKGNYVKAIPFLAMFTLYVVFMLPVEQYYRGLYPNLYYWAEQERYNSLAEETFGQYGVGIFGKTIFVIGHDFEMEEFTEQNFFKVFDRLKREDSTKVVHIDDIRDIGLIDTDQMLVIQEDPENNRFQDVTHTVKLFKCRPLYGYYDDGWLDEKSSVQVMAGSTGTINLAFTYPRDLQEDQWLTVYLNDEPYEYIHFTENTMGLSIQVDPYEPVTLRFETNFYVPNALEVRGDTNLAVLLTMQAD